MTNNPADEIFLKWSAEETQIAFTRDGIYEILVMNADGTDQTRLTDNAADDSDPVWQP